MIIISLSGMYYLYKSGNKIDSLRKGSEEISSQVTISYTFEVEQLKKYYIDALFAAKVTLYISMFAAIVGFMIIAYSIIFTSSDNISRSIIKISSGVIVDVVSALFFVQSNKSRNSMEVFFDKLRVDRMNLEARNIISEINNDDVKDQLRMQLVLKYAGIANLIESEKSH